MPKDPWSQISRWIEDDMQGRVLEYERQARWRPAYYLLLERKGGERLPLYFRGARPEIPASRAALEHEMRVLQCLEEAGIPVPHVYGFCEDPVGILMDRSPGQADLSTAPDPAERESILMEYMEILARMHRLDTAPFENIGMTRPTTNEELGLCDLARWEGGYRAGKKRPEPALEFLLAWLKRNIPEGRSQTSFLAADAGQFLFEKGRITALLDFELACLGDPAADLAGMRGRDLSEPLGDLPSAFARYFELVGEEIPTDVIDFHTVRFNLNTPLAVSGLVADPPPGTDVIQYLGWYWVWQRACFDVIAHGMSLEIPAIETPSGMASRFGMAHDALTRSLEQSSRAAEDGFATYEWDAAYRAATYLGRAERFAAELEAQDRDEAHTLLGRSFDSPQALDEALESWVLESGASRDEEFVTFFQRRAQRHEWLLEPVLREVANRHTQMLD